MTHIWVPQDTSRTPAYRCNICGTRFYDGEQRQWQKHVGDCARANLDDLKLLNKPIFEDPDPEVTVHLRKVGRRMIAEGRLEVKPEERAGFS